MAGVTRQLRLLIPLGELPLEVRLARRRKECQGGGDAGNTVEVDTRPGAEGRRAGEEDEGGDGEREGELRTEPGQDVVVAFVRGWAAAIWRKEERADQAARV